MFTSRRPPPTQCPSRCKPANSPFTFAIPGPDGKFGPTHADMISEANQNFYGIDIDHDLDSKDDIVTAEMAVPVNNEIHLLMHSKDVGHSFFVPELRIQQDFVPGNGPFPAFHSHQSWPIRDCLHATVRSRTLQHEGVSPVLSQEDFDAWLKEASRTAVMRYQLRACCGEQIFV